MDNGALGSHGLLVRLLVVKIQRNTPHELATIQHLYSVYWNRQETCLDCLNFLLGGNGCVGSAFNVTTCPELPDCSGSIAPCSPWCIVLLIVCPLHQTLVSTAPSTCPSLCSNPRDTTWCQASPWTPRCLCQSPYAWNTATNSCSLWCDCGCYGANNTLHAVCREKKRKKIDENLSHLFIVEHCLARRELFYLSMYENK